MWNGEMDAFEEWTKDMSPEKKAFIRVMLYHQRNGPATCSGDCLIPLGTSFAEHQWEEFEKLRNR